MSKVAMLSNPLNSSGFEGPLLIFGGFQLLDLIITELKKSRSLIGGNSICQKNPLQDLLSSLNAVISTNERH